MFYKQGVITTHPDIDADGRFAAAGLIARKGLDGTQPSLAVPAAYIDADTGLARGAASISRPGHRAHLARIIEIIWQIPHIEAWPDAVKD